MLPTGGVITAWRLALTVDAPAVGLSPKGHLAGRRPDERDQRTIHDDVAVVDRCVAAGHGDEPHRRLSKGGTGGGGRGVDETAEGVLAGGVGDAGIAGEPRLSGCGDPT